jgi:hypothetical protein
MMDVVTLVTKVLSRAAVFSAGCSATWMATSSTGFV